MKWSRRPLYALPLYAMAGTAVLAQTAPASPPAYGFSPAVEVNNALPSWLTFTGQYRARFEGYSGAGYARGASDAYMLSQLQLNLLVHPVPWLKIFAQGMDARAFAKEPAL